MKRERIKEIREYGLMVSCAPDSRGDIMPEELEELCDLALRATDPDMVMVRKQSLTDWCKFSVEISEQAKEVAMEIDGKLREQEDQT